MSKNENVPLIFLPNKKIKNLTNNWNKENNLEFYIDFETINQSVSDNEIIYLIGMIIKYPPNGNIFYKSYILNLKMKYNKNTLNLFCWGHAEKQMIKAVTERMFKINRPIVFPYEFIDMCKIFREEPILIKGAYKGFSLKNILSNMVKHKLIEQIHYEDFCTRGDISIVKAIEYYKTKNKDIKIGLIKYNEIDCLALMKIVNKIKEFC